MTTSDLHRAISLAKTIEALYANDIGPNIVCARTDTQVLVEKMAEGQFAIIFPGTASLHDWLTDVRILKIPWSGRAGKAHNGAASAYTSVHDGIKKILPPGVRLIIAGHSLGGALATLCADILAADFPIDQVITFGSLRVGNAAFARQYNSKLDLRTVRYVNAGDPVPHVPFVFGTYRHVDTQHYLTDDGEIIVDEPLRVLASEWAGTLHVLQDPPAALAFASDHGITHYRKKLELLPL